MQTRLHIKRLLQMSRWTAIVTSLLGAVLWAGPLQAESPSDGGDGSGASTAAPIIQDEAALQKRAVIGAYEPLTYTVGPDDVIEISVRRHPEFSGPHTIGKDGKIQYRFVGDIQIAGLNKAQVIEKIQKALAVYVVDPEVDIVITEFRSKVVYVVGEVSRPGRYYLRSDAIPLREVVFEAGLPTLASAMRRTLIIHPQITEGKNRGQIPIDKLNLYALLYQGDLTKNVPVLAGDVVYVPSTVFHKAARVLDPLLDPVYKAAVARQLVE